MYFVITRHICSIIIILVVDDDESHRLLIRRALRELGAEVLEVSTPTDAHSALHTHAAALRLVILDMNLRGKPGLDVLRSFRATYPYESLPVILLSTSALEIDVHQAYQEGANCYILKETDPRQFNSTVASAARFFLRR